MPGIRLVVGPNGSGKTTLTRQLREKHAVPLGQYLNPDDIAKHIDFQSIIDNLPPEKAEESAAILARNISIGLRNDWIRDHLSFTYESVMSHKSHVDSVQQAKK